ncbi:adhesion protein FadA [Sebaldella sp. S0638]|uniref:adhesion protein FadA n=1 Tax=Sebaldella sp. S0638 TaxID=2957809 RepID=UPI00209FD0BA|nr:adhesion protein FadA [Sebaldella sp. S0638]MCP1223686.1 adhesion protein FadA [Sebaldella sp. S0638]
MKKIVLTGLFIAASLSFAATASDIERQAAAIDNQISVIEAKTAATLQAEQQRAETATDNVAKYSELLENVQDQIDVVSGERKVSFYEKEYQGVLASLTSLRNDLQKSITANQKVVDAYEEFSAIVGN